MDEAPRKFAGKAAQAALVATARQDRVKAFFILTLNAASFLLSSSLLFFPHRRRRQLYLQSTFWPCSLSHSLSEYLYDLITLFSTYTTSITPPCITLSHTPKTAHNLRLVFFELFLKNNNQIQSRCFSAPSPPSPSWPPPPTLPLRPSLTSWPRCPSPA